jgi:hypothetical protein
MLRNLRLFAFSFVIATSSLTAVNVQSAKADWLGNMGWKNPFGTPTVDAKTKFKTPSRPQPTPVQKPQPASNNDCSGFWCQIGVEVGGNTITDFFGNNNNSQNSQSSSSSQNPFAPSPEMNPKGNTPRTGGSECNVFVTWPCP